MTRDIGWRRLDRVEGLKENLKWKDPQEAYIAVEILSEVAWSIEWSPPGGPLVLRRKSISAPVEFQLKLSGRKKAEALVFVGSICVVQCRSQDSSLR
ncbi:hypothetical protein GLAREA_03273 [Glarea lozoyensis ATCC 20868]|uniref:Uncharacterized protein n=1 Tax=Glarea lozoyensis (strain ATCC 20868 / MF5171) TaxID=1116229 RepID=S3DLD0_GLAL2|nr:uncharacterized protein GLAREA_03273 [Glarea lozoyensis ATCC 20868]EPE27358.1 hypothetical protein GLAREA_03273 [Glarea lozoyensis ATCC 20868]